MDKDAPPSTGWYDFLGWLEANKQRVAIGVAAALVVGTVIGFFVWRSGQKRIDAEQALSSVRLPFSPGQPYEPGTADALLKVANEHPGTLAAAKAVLRAGTVLFEQRDYARAQEQFDRFLREQNETPWVPQAVFGIAASLEGQGKIAEALARYTNFIATYPNDPAVDQARLTAARLHEQMQQPALALEVLNKIVSNQQGGFTPMAAEAQQKIRELHAKYPALAPSNPPPFTPSPASLTNIIRVTNAVAPTNRVITITNSPRPAAPATPPPANPAPANPAN